MEIKVTTDVIHKVNSNYYSAVVQFEDKDKHFFKEKMNWMPKDVEVFAIFKVLYGLSPTFRVLVDKEFRKKEE